MDGVLAWLKDFFPRPFKWVQNLLGGGEQRVHAFVIILIAVTLCVGTLSLTTAILVATYYQVKDPAVKVPNLIAELGLFVTAITSLGGYIYNRGKTSEEKKVTP